jgi:hypothetical protein
MVVFIVQATEIMLNSNTTKKLSTCVVYIFTNYNTHKPYQTISILHGVIGYTSRKAGFHSTTVLFSTKSVKQ